MSEIRSYWVCRHLRGEQSCHILKYHNGELKRSCRGASFWFMPLSTSIAEVPIDDRELTFVFHGRSSDFQDVTVQGVITYRVVDATTAADRIDFTIHLDTGAYRKEPLEQIAMMLTELAQQFAWAYLAKTPIVQALSEGHEQIRQHIESRLQSDRSLAEMGIEIINVRVSGVKPTADLERALEMPTREHLQQEADEATFQRRAMAVEKERAIQENELQNQIELARREEQLIDQRGQNERRQATEQAEAQRIRTEAKARHSRIEADAKAENIRVVEEVKVTSERQRMEIYAHMPPSVIAGLAARDLAGKLEKIEHLNISPELLGPMLMQLVQAGTAKLGEPRS